MKNIFAIALNEVRRIFRSPLAWVLLAVLQAIFGWVFAGTLVQYLSNNEVPDQSLGVSDYIGANLFGSTLIFMLVVMPLMTMRVFADERRSGTLTLLFSSPISLIEIVLGKFFGLMAFVLALVALLALMPLSLLHATHLDLGRTGAGLFGLTLLMMAFAACGLFISSLTREPIIAAVFTFAALILIWLLKMLAGYDGWYAPVADYLSLITHFQNLLSGLFDLSDVAYYLLFTLLFLWLTVLRLDIERN